MMMSWNLQKMMIHDTLEKSLAADEAEWPVVGSSSDVGMQCQQDLHQSQSPDQIVGGNVGQDDEADTLDAAVGGG